MQINYQDFPRRQRHSYVTNIKYDVEGDCIYVRTVHAERSFVDAAKLRKLDEEGIIKGDEPHLDYLIANTV